MKTLFIPSLLLTVLLVAVPLVAPADTSEITSIKQQVQTLEERVTRLETIRPTFTSFMPDLAERFHVMHLAGDAGDWAVAAHELNEIHRMTEFSKYIDTEKGALMESMLDPHISALESAIEHGNHKKFVKALHTTTDTCNACHVASGSPFIKVTLEVEDVMSLRHPHVLSKQAAPHGHSH